MPERFCGSSLSSTKVSICSSKASGILYPSPLKILIPLYSAGLCEAEIIIPASALYFPTRYATAGVGTTPRMITSTPTEHKPEAMLKLSISDEILVSEPTQNKSLLLLPSERTVPAALPTFTANSHDKNELAIPLIPSVPNNLPIYINRPSYFLSIICSASL